MLGGLVEIRNSWERYDLATFYRLVGSDGGGVKRDWRLKVRGLDHEEEQSSEIFFHFFFSAGSYAPPLPLP